MSRDHEAMSLLWRAVRSDLPDAALGVFRSTGPLSAPGAIAVYKNAYWVRQHAALRDLFPRLLAHLGERQFRELVRRYLLARPSAHPELERLGAGLAEHLRRDPAHGELAQLAALEHAQVESFLEVDAPIARLAEIDPATFAEARLRFAPSLRVVPADPVLLHVLAREGSSAIGAAAAVVSRPGFVTVTHLIAVDELELLELARGGTPIHQLLAHVGGDVAGLHVPVRQWFLRSWVASITTEMP